MLEKSNPKYWTDKHLQGVKGILAKVWDYIEEEDCYGSEHHKRLLSIWNSLCEKEINIRKRLGIEHKKECVHNFRWGKCLGRKCENAICLLHHTHRTKWRGLI